MASEPWESWIPEPLVILVGCQAWPPRPDPDRPCPVCDRGINARDKAYYCAKCDSLSPQREAQVRAARLGLKARDRAEAVGRKAAAALRKKSGVTLSESDRRRIWNGYRRTILSEVAEPTNLARAGREWLTAIGQVPDWSLILDSRGKATRRDPGASDGPQG